MKLFDWFLIGALTHFCALGLYLVRYIDKLEQGENE